MQRQPVVSSNIKSIGLEGNVLEIEFTDGGRVYQYTGDTAAAHHSAMIKAESIGQYFGRYVRNDPQLQAKRVDEGAAAPGVELR